MNRTSRWRCISPVFSCVRLHAPPHSQTFTFTSRCLCKVQGNLLSKRMTNHVLVHNHVLVPFLKGKKEQPKANGYLPEWSWISFVLVWWLALLIWICGEEKCMCSHIWHYRPCLDGRDSRPLRKPFIRDFIHCFVCLVFFFFKCPTHFNFPSLCICLISLNHFGPHGLFCIQRF